MTKEFDTFREVEAQLNPLTDHHVILKIQFPVYSIDRMPQLMYKLSMQLNINPVDIYCIVSQTVGSNTIVLEPHKYFINNKLIEQQRPDFMQQLAQDLKVRKTYENEFKFFGKIPIHRSMLDVTSDVSDFELPFNIYNETGFLGDFFDTKRSIRIEILSLDSIKKDSIYQQMVQNEHYQQILNHVFIKKFFPNSLQTGQFNILRQDRMSFYKNEQQIFNDTLQSYQSLDARYTVQTVKYTFEFIGRYFDLKNLFNEIRLKSFYNLTYIQYFYHHELAQYVVTKSQKLNQEIPIHQFYEDEINARSDRFFIKIFADGRVEIQLQILKAFEQIPSINQLEIWQNEVFEVIEQLNQFRYQFSSGKLSLKKAIIQRDVDLVVTINGIQNPLQFYMILQKQLQDNKLIFQYIQQKDRFRTFMLMGYQSLFNIEAKSQQIQLIYSGRLHRYIEVFVQLLMSLVTDQNIKMQSQKGEQDVLRSQQLMRNDPYLFTKTNNNPYSRACQSGRKPLNVTQADLPNTYKYWNFTTNQPQYYQCPEKYKYMYFLTKQHPDNLCVPCCTNNNPLTSVKKKQKYLECLKTRTVSNNKGNVSYAYKNPHHFQQDRLTVIEDEIYTAITELRGSNTKWYVLCKTLPQYFARQYDQIITLVQSVAYLLDVSTHSFLELAKTYFKNIGNHQMQQQVSDFQQQSILNEINMTQWLLYLSHFVTYQYQTNIILIIRQDKITLRSVEFNTSSSSQSIRRITEKSLLLFQKNDTINPIVFVDQSAVTRLIPNNMIQALINKLDKQQTNQMQQTAQVIIDRLMFSSLKLKVQLQIVNHLGICHFLQLQHKDAGILLLPVSESAPIDSIQTSTEIPSLDLINKSSDIIDVLLELYNTNPETGTLINSMSDHSQGQQNQDVVVVQQKIGKQLKFIGLYIKHLFFYINTQQIPSQYARLQTHVITYNPMQINYLISKQSKNTFKTQQAYIYSAALKTVYTNYLYQLIKLQHFNFQAASQLQSIPDTKQFLNNFEFVEPEEITQRITKYIQTKSNNKELTELRLLNPCIRDPSQFFCNGNKMLLPKKAKFYFELLARDLQSDKTTQTRRILSILIADFQFAKQPGEFIDLLKIPGSKWKQHKTDSN